jgi:hypothetical protein
MPVASRGGGHPGICPIGAVRRSARGQGHDGLFRHLKRVAGLGILAALSACASGGAPWGGGDPTEVTFAPELGIFLDQMTLTPEGLYYHDLVEGTGALAQLNDRVTLHYNGSLPDGTLFDSSVASQEPVRFVLGRREVIRGWELGVQGMKVGGRRLLVIPPDLAYGSRGRPPVIPRNATLVFEVQLLAVGD